MSHCHYSDISFHGPTPLQFVSLALPHHVSCTYSLQEYWQGDDLTEPPSEEQGAHMQDCAVLWSMVGEVGRSG